jgi:hypothetical protein
MSLPSVTHIVVESYATSLPPHYAQHSSIPHSSSITTLLLCLVYPINERWKKEGKMEMEEVAESLGLFVYLFQASTVVAPLQKI